MNPAPSHPALCLAALTAWLLAVPAQAQAPAPAPQGGSGVYRCGSSYSSTPCPGGQQVSVDDPRSDEQRRQAQAVKQQDAALARTQAAERRQRERAQAHANRHGAAGIGPTAAERARAEAEADAKAEAAKVARDGKDGKRRPARRTHRAPAAALAR